MARFNLDEYETVEQRHARAIAEYPDLRVEMINHTTSEDRQRGEHVVECRVYLNAGDQALGLFKASEWAFERDGGNGPNATSALENALTSALGRCLRWALGGSKGPSREEMEKVARGVPAQAKSAPAGFLDAIAMVESLDELKVLWADAVAGGFQGDVMAAVTRRKGELNVDA